MLFSHVTIGSDDLNRSKKFYDALFDVIGNFTFERDDAGRLFYIKNEQFLLITKPVNGAPAAPGNGWTIGFALPSVKAVNQWHDSGIKNGGASAENPPGLREHGGVKRYLSYLRDPDGNKLCGYYLLEE